MIQLFNEDNMVLMARYPDKYFDLAIVDPPYGININMNIGKKKGEKGRYEKKNWDKEIPTTDYFNELIRVSKNQIIWGGNYFTEYLRPSMGWIFWDKAIPKGVSFSDGELAWTSYNIALKKIHLPYCGFIGIDTVKRIHPTQKPIDLYRNILKLYAKPGYKIIDTHFGSLSIGLACWIEKYDLVACEIDKDYYEAGLKRLKLEQNKLSIEF